MFQKLQCEQSQTKEYLRKDQTIIQSEFGFQQNYIQKEMENSQQGINQKSQIPFFKTNINPFNKQNSTIHQQKLHFEQIQIKNLEYEEFDEENKTYAKIIQNDESQEASEFEYMSDKSYFIQNIAITKDLESMSQSSSSNNGQTTSSYIMWEQVMQNRKNLISILCEDIFEDKSQPEYIKTQNKNK